VLKDSLAAISTSAGYLSGSCSELALNMGEFLMGLAVGIIITCVIGAAISANGGPDILATVAEWASFGLKGIIAANTTLPSQIAADLAGATVFGVGAVATGLIGFGLYSRNAKNKGVALAVETFAEEMRAGLTVSTP